MTPDGMIWYTDFSRGYLGRLDPGTGETAEWAAPQGAESRPYAVTADDQGRLWFSETGPQKRLVGFDPATEQFFADLEVSGNIRHMMFDEETGMLWFGTDANNIGRAVVSPAVM
jgi:virginiamycin B lyase